MFLGCLAAAGCAINPATGKNQLMLVSEDQGIAMGRQADTAIIATIGLYPDAAWQTYIQQFGERLAATSERPDLPWTFRVVDDPAVNAFAVPGGFVYVTRGLLTHITSQAELASVVGHEIGHITARHSAAERSKQQLIGRRARPALHTCAARTPLARLRCSPVSAETLALISQVGLDTPLASGRLVKWVTGPAQPPPSLPWPMGPPTARQRP